MGKGLRISLSPFLDHDILIDFFIDRLLAVFAKYRFRHFTDSEVSNIPPSRGLYAALLGPVVEHLTDSGPSSVGLSRWPFDFTAPPAGLAALRLDVFFESLQVTFNSTGSDSQHVTTLFDQAFWLVNHLKHDARVLIV